jgi:hypothetical protein
VSQFLFGCASRRTRGRFRGIRHSVVWDASEMFSRGRTNSPKGQMADATWRAGFARLAPLNLTLEPRLYHLQLMELADLARAFPQTTIILNHVGGPLGIRPYADRKQETFAAWKTGIAELGKCQKDQIDPGLGRGAGRSRAAGMDCDPPCRCASSTTAAISSSAIVWFVSVANSRAVASKSPLFRATIATSAPSRANSRAMALPMPRLPPVTIACLSCNPRSMAFFPLSE